MGAHSPRYANTYWFWRNQITLDGIFLGQNSRKCAIVEAEGGTEMMRIHHCITRAPVLCLYCVFWESRVMLILFSFSLFHLVDQKYGVCGYKMEQKLKILTFGIMIQKQKFPESFLFLFFIPTTLKGKRKQLQYEPNIIIFTDCILCA